MQLKQGFFPTTFFAVLMLCSAGHLAPVRAASWQGIEPFKSRRADVIKILGQPISESAGGMLRFAVIGGSVQISFVDEKFVTTKKLQKDIAGTVLQVILQHSNSSDTPESMNLLKNKAFIRDDNKNISVFRSPKEGIVYTFIDGKLKTTRYTFADGQLAKARR
jgi:hypothetical protein